MVFFKALQDPPPLFPAPSLPHYSHDEMNPVRICWKPDSTEYATIIRNLTLLTTTSIFFAKKCRMDDHNNNDDPDWLLYFYFYYASARPQFQQLMAKKAGERPPTGLLSGYTQTYLIWKSKDFGAAVDDEGGGGKEADEQTEHEVLFRCGNWCYTGHVVLRNEIALEDMPVAIPLLQRQQSRLHYYCNAESIPPQSNFFQPMQFVYDGADFAARCLAADHVTDELGRLADVYEWMETDAGNTFFEMKADSPPFMDDISLVCSKTYARGLIFVAVYFEGSFYFTVSEGEGDQPLLDVKFPDVSHHGQGCQLLSQQMGSPDGAPLPPWFASLSLWHSMPSELKIAPPPTRNLSTSEYIQVRFYLLLLLFFLLFYFCRRCCFPSVVRVSFKKNGISNDMPHQNCIHPRCTSSCARGRRTVASR
jgi:hypothetical protein